MRQNSNNVQKEIFTDKKYVAICIIFVLKEEFRKARLSVLFEGKLSIKTPIKSDLKGDHFYQ
ncbi:hypothetical protein T10_8721 [Trichinella papuae]|uniref:Uncharacterized protein n=1 Tax=Trichinella papuae TaxID=268474 RepID=A0A0V1M6P0_9BILA|nr:hypothetical protein T10_8721 [Trichinella papuae]